MWPRPAPLIRSDPPGPIPPSVRSGDYLTDGHRLFRVVGPSSAGGPFVHLEDCLTLQVLPYSPGELEAMALRMVRRRESERPARERR